MASFHYRLLDVFTNKPFSGNQLAVFSDAADIPEDSMLSIARELNLSETTFVLPPSDPQKADFKVRIFTPASELPMAGHPTVGTAFVLASEGRTGARQEPNIPRIHYSFEEKVGIIPVSVDLENGRPGWIKMRQPLPTFGSRFDDVWTMAEMLSLEPGDILDTNLPIEVVSCGVPFVFVPIKDLNAIRKIKLRVDIWEKALRNFEASQLFVFTQEVEDPRTSKVHSRMFAPAFGISEDPATGGASGPLGCYLVKNGVFKGQKAEFIGEQGFEIGRPSLIKIAIESGDGKITGVEVSGQCCEVGEGTITA